MLSSVPQMAVLRNFLKRSHCSDPIPRDPRGRPSRLEGCRSAVARQRRRAMIVRVNWRKIEKQAETGDPVEVKWSAFDDDPLERLPEEASLLVHATRSQHC